jgi:hypothetical protein
MDQWCNELLINLRLCDTDAGDFPSYRRVDYMQLDDCYDVLLPLPIDAANCLLFCRSVPPFFCLDEDLACSQIEADTAATCCNEKWLCFFLIFKSCLNSRTFLLGHLAVEAQTGNSIQPLHSHKNNIEVL